MQEEVNQKTVSPFDQDNEAHGKVAGCRSREGGAGTAKAHRKALTPQGRQSVKKLMNHYGGKAPCPMWEPKGF